MVKSQLGGWKMVELETLLSRIAGGDQTAFAALYEAQRRSMLAHAAGVLAGDMSDAEDAVDEAFLDIWQQAGKFAGTGSAAGWIRRIVRNKAINLLRKKGGRENIKPQIFFTDIADERRNPEEYLLLDDEQRWLKSVLAVLSPEQREAITLCYFEGLSMQEISETVDCPINTVKTRLHYARTRLHNWMLEQYDVSRFEHFTTRANWERTVAC